jgi:hypothetical protein
VCKSQQGDHLRSGITLPAALSFSGAAVRQFFLNCSVFCCTRVSSRKKTRPNQLPELVFGTLIKSAMLARAAATAVRSVSGLGAASVRAMSALPSAAQGDTYYPDHGPGERESVMFMSYVVSMRV